LAGKAKIGSGGSLTTNEKYLAAVDLGGTKVTTLIVSGVGKIIARQEKPLSTTGGAFVPRSEEIGNGVHDSVVHGGGARDGVSWFGPSTQIEEMLRGMLKDAGINKLAGIGIGSAGPLRSRPHFIRVISDLALSTHIACHLRRLQNTL